MTADANTCGSPHPEPVAQPAARSRKPLFLVVGAVVAAVIAAALVVVFTLSGTIAVNGTLALLCDYKCTKATADGYDGYRDLHDGSQVTLVDETGQIVATAELRRTPGEDTNIVNGGVWVRTFTFTFADVPDADRYGVHVGNSNRGTLWKTAEETEREGFHLTIGG
ncbi:hypothetical protein [Amycolatopsis sp.]|uniref:hypothetical protein n=1 Tax=Amycolatopsis sp. TaxID=37632 RepID=UPI002D7E6B26|nr:hypothetical protein [Amycolatopsis sp.]HET6704032.1 hypothetical protein [Amycolatopsis sp.]